MEEVKTKVCPKCGEEKPLTVEFWRYRKDNDRWRNECKSCMAQLNKKWRNENKNILSLKAKEYRINHKEHFIEYRKLYYQNNKTKILQQTSEYHRKHYIPHPKTTPVSKICPICKEEKPLTQEFWRLYYNNIRNKKYYQYICKKCSVIQTKLWQLKNKQHYKEWEKKHHQTSEYKQNAKSRNAKYIQSDKGQKRKKERYHIQVGGLADTYIRSRLNAQLGLTISDITPEMIELKRVQIQLFRKTKQFLKEEAA